MEHYDTLIIGGGIFGCYAALLAKAKGQRVLLIERENALMGKASVINQARLHSGYHYPRSIATARMSDENKARFTREHHDFINFQFEKYYAIDRYGSFTDAAQFARFCAYVGLPCKMVKKHPLFNYERLEAVFATEEYTFDPVLLAQYYREKLEDQADIKIALHSELIEADSAGSQWEVTAQIGSQIKKLSCQRVINATYAGSNAMNELFGQTKLKLMHELSEMAFVNSPQLRHIGLTVMDGPFGSIMPYGKSGLHSLSAVAYTHQKVSYESFPKFDCQDLRSDCSPSSTANCSGCHYRPKSNYLKMAQQMKQYLSPSVDLQYFNSRFTIKSKLRANFIDDGRPTEISYLSRSPDFICVFAGKINSIYELEKVI